MKAKIKVPNLIKDKKSCFVKVVYPDETFLYFECGSWDFAHNSKMLMLNSVNETPEAKLPRIGINMDSVKFFIDITDNKELLDGMKEGLGDIKLRRVI